MNKSILCSAIIAAIVLGGNLQAAEWENIGNSFDGFYLGAGIGASATTYRNTFYDSLLGEDEDMYGKRDIGKSNALLGHIFTGVGKTFDRFYAGAEIAGFYSSSKSTVEPELSWVTGSYDFKTTYSYGILARLGFLTSPKTLFYVALGPQYSQFEGVFQNQSFKKREMAVAGGIGLETFLNQWSLRLQYLYASYSKIKNAFMFNTIDEGTESYKPAQGLFSLDLSYYFRSPDEYSTPPALLSGEATHRAFDGIYLGGALNAARLDTHGVLNYIIGTLSIAASDTNNINKTVWGGSVFGGAGYVSEGGTGYWGGEVFYRYNKTDEIGLSLVSESGSPPLILLADYGQIQNTHSYGLLTRFGYLPTEWSMFYALLGIEQSTFKIKNLVQIEQSPGVIVDEIIQCSKSRVGVLGGVGLELSLSQHFSTRAEYTISYYGTVKYRNVIIDGLEGEIQLQSLMRSLFNVGLVYYF